MYLVLFCIMNMNILYYVVKYQSSSQNREITNKYVVVVVADCKLLLLLGVQFTNNTKVL